MRKYTRVLILLLMLCTSLTAGTLAVYTSRIDLTPVTISAKRFVLGVDQGGQDEFDLRIGPGETVSYQFVVTNENASAEVSEVDMDLYISADFSNIRASMPSVGIQLLLNGSQVAAADSAGSLSYYGASVFQASQAKDLDFTLTFDWSGGSGSAVDGNSVVLPLTIYVKGVQHVS